MSDCQHMQPQCCGHANRDGSCCNNPVPGQCMGCEDCQPTPEPPTAPTPRETGAERALHNILIHTARAFNYSHDVALLNGLLDSIARIAKDALATPRPDAASASVTEAMVEAAYRVMRDEYHDRALISPCSVRMSLEAALAAAPVPSASVTDIAPGADLPKLEQPPECPGWRGDATVTAFRERLELRIREAVDQVAIVAGHASGAHVTLKSFDRFLDCLCDAAAGAARAALAAAPRDAGREEDMRPWAQRAADALALEVLALTRDGKLSSRSPAGDALLSYASTRFGDADPLGNLERAARRGGAA